MKAEMRTVYERKLRIEYPFFSGEGEETSLANRFSEALVSAFSAKARSDPEGRYRLTYSLSEKDGETLTVFQMTVSKNGSVVSSKRLRVLWKDGFIKKYEEETAT